MKNTFYKVLLFYIFLTITIDAYAGDGYFICGFGNEQYFSNYNDSESCAFRSFQENMKPVIIQSNLIMTIDERTFVQKSTGFILNIVSIMPNALPDYENRSFFWDELDAIFQYDCVNKTHKILEGIYRERGIAVHQTNLSDAVVQDIPDRSVSEYIYESFCKIHK